MKVDASKLNNDEKREKISRGQGLSTYFCIGFSKVWQEKIYIIIIKLRDSNGINWLCTPMSYHRLPNLGEILQGYLVSKLRNSLEYNDSIDIECNYNLTTKVNGICAYIGECRRCCVVYKVTCQCCGDFYVGNTQNTLKKKGTSIPRLGPKIHER